MISRCPDCEHLRRELGLVHADRNRAWQMAADIRNAKELALHPLIEQIVLAGYAQYGIRDLATALTKVRHASSELCRALARHWLMTHRAVEDGGPR